MEMYTHHCKGYRWITTERTGGGGEDSTECADVIAERVSVPYLWSGNYGRKR